MKEGKKVAKKSPKKPRRVSSEEKLRGVLTELAQGCVPTTDIECLTVIRDLAAFHCWGIDKTTRMFARLEAAGWRFVAQVGGSGYLFRKGS